MYISSWCWSRVAKWEKHPAFFPLLKHECDDENSSHEHQLLLLLANVSFALRLPAAFKRVMYKSHWIIDVAGTHLLHTG